MLYQLSYAPSIGSGLCLVGLGGLEPPTPRLSSVCSNQLSYKPKAFVYFLCISNLQFTDKCECESAPNPKHATWLYISSGLSNPWEDDAPDPTGYSGLGCEFVFETSLQGFWAIQRVQHLIAFQTLLSCGRYPGRDLVEVYDRIPLRASLTPEASDLTWLFIAPPAGYPASLRLQSGRVDLLRVLGITEAEAQFARSRGGEELVEVLRHAGAFPITDPRRRCTVASGAV